VKATGNYLAVSFFRRGRINASRRPNAIKVLASRTGMVMRGLMRSNSWPISQGKTIPPMPPPTRIQPIMAPVRLRRCSAKAMPVAKTEAIERPITIVPAQSAGEEAGQSSRMAKATRHPARSVARMA